MDISKSAINNRFIESVSSLKRNTTGLSKKKIAEALGIGQTKLSEILGCRMGIGPDLAAKFCMVYKVDLHWLLTGVKAVAEKEYNQERHLQVNEPQTVYSNASIQILIEENKLLREQLSVLQDIVKEQQAIIDAFKSGAIVVTDPTKD